MPLYNFKTIQIVPTSKDFIDIVLSRTQRQTPTVVHNGWAINRIRQFYMRKVRPAAGVCVFSAWHAPAACRVRGAQGGAARARRPLRRARLVGRRSHALADAPRKFGPWLLATRVLPRWRPHACD
jgi:hypothetical protein